MYFFIVFLLFLGLLPRHMEFSQARGLIVAVAASLCQSHSNEGSEPRLQPIYTTAHSNAGSLTH